jgi:hypothetical protein
VHSQALAALEFSDPEVGDHCVAAYVDHDVARLHVAVHDTMLVRVLQRTAHLMEQRLDNMERQRTGLLQYRLKLATFDVLHHEEVESTCLLRRVNRHNVGMLQPGNESGLLHEALDHGRIRHERRRHDLDGHLLVERDVVGQVHRSHAPMPQLPGNVKLAAYRGAQ